MKAFLLNKDLDGYLQQRIESEPFKHKKFRINHDTVLKIFDNWQSFEEILAKQNELDYQYLKEFKLFFEKVKANGFNEFMDFHFQTIPLPKSINGGQD